jgi:hypothetical protein
MKINNQRQGESLTAPPQGLGKNASQMESTSGVLGGLLKTPYDVLNLALG